MYLNLNKKNLYIELSVNVHMVWVSVCVEWIDANGMALQLERLILIVLVIQNAVADLAEYDAAGGCADVVRAGRNWRAG